MVLANNSVANTPITNWNATRGITIQYVNADWGTTKPSTYGIIVNFNPANGDLAQFYFTQASGAVYHRQGNGSGWFGNADDDNQILWRKFFDDSMTIPVANGGTGQTTLALARNAMGLGNTTGAVPIANGGTGQTTAALARNALGLGNTTGAVPIANGGTGATTVAAAVAALGFVTGKLSVTRAATGTTFTSVSFGKTFSSAPIVIFSWGSSNNIDTSSANPPLLVTVPQSSITTTGFQTAFSSNIANSRTVEINWLAIGV